MAKKKRVLTEVQRLTKNIKQTIRRAIKRGYVFEDINFRELSLEQLRELTGKGIYKRGYYVLQDTGEVISGTTGLHIERQAAARKGLATKKRREALAKQAELDNARYDLAVAQQAYDRAIAIINNLKSQIVSMQMPDVYKRKVKGIKFEHKRGYLETERIISAKIMLINYVDGAVAKAGATKVAENYENHMQEINEILDYLRKYGVDENDYTGGHPKLARFAEILVGRVLSSDEFDDLGAVETGLNYVEDMM